MTTHPIPDAALEADIAVLGKKGRGKTYTAKGCVERLLALGRRVVVLDPLSTWWGLKAGPNAFPVAVLGGPHGDLPLRDVDGEALGRALAHGTMSAVLDLGAMRKAELIRFAAPFLEELYTHNRDPLWLVLEEADVFAPQNPAGDQARLYGEVDRIARRGRQFGFRLITLTQRPARLAKDVLTQLSTLVAMGITSPQDRDAIKAWVEGNADRDQAKSVVDSLAGLKVGEGWVWAPDLDLLERVTFPPIRTPDTSATPKVGERRADAKLRTDVDLEPLRAALAVVSNGKAGGETQESLSSPADTQAALQAAEQRGYDQGYLHGQSRGRSDGRIDLATALEGMAATLRTGTGDVDDGTPASSATPAAAQTRERKAAPVASGSDGPLHGAAQKMLAVLDTNPPVVRTWTQVATLAGLKARGGHFNAGRKAMLDSGRLRVRGELVAIAEASADAQPAPADPAALVEMWAGVLDGAAPRILRQLFVEGRATRRQRIATALGLKPAGGHWNAAWKQLRDNDLVRVDGEVAHLTIAGAGSR